MLTNEQHKIFELYEKGENVFMTGPGGVGKSKLIRDIVKHAKETNKKYCVTALTGAAAICLDCGAKTLHSWAGIGLGVGETKDICERINKSKYKRKNWKQTEILIVDEVSMLSTQMFELLNDVGQYIRSNHQPFGGIQLIFSGDFCQLPPVVKGCEKQSFCFQSPLWDQTFSIQIELTTIFRQSDDKYKKILNNIRLGKLTKSGLVCLNERVGISPPSNIICPKIMPTRHAVEVINNTELNKLLQENDSPLAKEIYRTKQADQIDLNLTLKETQLSLQFSQQQKDIEYDTMKKGLLCDETLELVVGAHVMCIANIDMESSYPVCNGSQGIVVKFSNKGPIVKFNNGSVRTINPHIWKSDTIPSVGVSQLPLILAWAITIHKSQGITLDYGEINAGSGIFECGQTYVALSRIKSLDGLYLTSFDPNKIKINSNVVEYYNNLRKT